VFNFGTIDIESSLAPIDPNSLRGELLTVSGQLFNQAQMDKTGERLTLVVSEQGYAFARVRPRAARDPSGRAITVSYLIDAGPRVYLARINIIGNQRTRDYVIRREFRLAEGDAYNPLLVDKAKKRLQVLGYFKTVNIKRQPGSAPDRVVLDVELVEQSTGELSFGAGYSTSEGVIGDISIAERNLKGRGQFLRLRLAGSLERLQIDLSFTEPRFLDRNLSAGFDLFHKVSVNSSTQPFDSRSTGGSVRLGFPLSENLWLVNSYSLINNNIDNVQAGASRALIEAQGEYWTSVWGSNLSYDKRNHPKDPTSGYYLSVGSELAGLGGDVS
jgi:outer membrane protein insertion porin family